MSQPSKAGTPRMVRCPGCGAPAAFAASNPWRPFCSERCRNGDLGAWASESYRVAAQPEPDDEALSAADPLAPPAWPRH